MDPQLNPTYLRSVQKALIEFRALLVQYLALHQERSMPLGGGLMPAIYPKDDHDPSELARLKAELGRASGRASEATALTGAAIAVEGVKGAVDPIVNWRFMDVPKPIVYPSDVLGATDYALGRLEAMIEKAEAAAPPTIGVTQLHPLVWGAAQRLWRDGHYRQAVVRAGDAVEQHVRSLIDRYDIAGADVWNKAFTSKPLTAGQKKLLWPGNPEHQTVKAMNDGLIRFAPGVQMTIRNPATHNQGAEYAEQEALERLATLSLLMHWVDECDVVTGESVDGVDPVVSPPSS